MEIWAYFVIAPIIVTGSTLLIIDALFGAFDDSFGGIVEIFREVIAKLFGR